MKSYLIQMKYYLIKMKLKLIRMKFEFISMKLIFYALFIGNLIYLYVKESSEILFSTNEVTFHLVLSRWLNKMSQQRVIL